MVYYYFRIIFFAVIRYTFFPRIMVGVHQFQPFSYLLESDTRTALVVMALREVAVTNLASNISSNFRHLNIDITRFGRRNTMFESVLDERNENERRVGKECRSR